jgi:hypothetical protein
VGEGQLKSCSDRTRQKIRDRYGVDRLASTMDRIYREELSLFFTGAVVDCNSKI